MWSGPESTRDISVISCFCRWFHGTSSNKSTWYQFNGKLSLSRTFWNLFDFPQKPLRCIKIRYYFNSLLRHLYTRSISQSLYSFFQFPTIPTKHINMACCMWIYYNISEKNSPNLLSSFIKEVSWIPQKIALSSSKSVIHFLKEKLFCIKKTNKQLPLFLLFPSLFLLLFPSLSHYVSWKVLIWIFQQRELMELF